MTPIICNEIQKQFINSPIRKEKGKRIQSNKWMAMPKTNIAKFRSNFFLVSQIPMDNFLGFPPIYILTLKFILNPVLFISYEANWDQNLKAGGLLGEWNSGCRKTLRKSLQNKTLSTETLKLVPHLMGSSTCFPSNSCFSSSVSSKNPLHVSITAFIMLSGTPWLITWDTQSLKLKPKIKK